MRYVDFLSRRRQERALVPGDVGGGDPAFLWRRRLRARGLLRNPTRTGRVGLGERRGARQNARNPRSLARRSRPAGRRPGVVSRATRRKGAYVMELDFDDGDQLEWR